MKPSGKISSENVFELPKTGAYVLTGKKRKRNAGKGKAQFAAARHCGRIDGETEERLTARISEIQQITLRRRFRFLPIRRLFTARGGEWKSAYPCNAGRAYAIKLVIDTDSDTYDLYVDGNKIEKMPRFCISCRI